MTHSLQARALARRILIAATLLAAWALTGAVVAQADGIVFDVEIVRVDLVRGEDGDIEERFVPVEEAIPGEVIEYRVTARNQGDVIYRPGTVVVTLPIGEGLAYLEGSATPSSERVVTEFSADGGVSYAEPPVLVAVASESDGADGADGSDAESRVAEPAEYDHIRWTFSVPFEPGQEELLVYRVEVR
jgi:uncharacterized repeat protein (TIGR01451 family)